MYSLLSHININFDYQAKFDWASNKKYDFYIPSTNTIIETNGIQHYEEKICFTHSSLDDIQENDNYKYINAIKNGIDKYIVIDTSSSDFVKIKENILKSELNEMFTLDLLKDDDWFNIEKKTLKSVFITCVDLWNDGLCVSQIVEKVKLFRKTIAGYLRTANRLNMCDYNTSEARSRWRKYYEQCKQ